MSLTDPIETPVGTLTPGGVYALTLRHGAPTEDFVPENKEERGTVVAFHPYADEIRTKLQAAVDLGAMDQDAVERAVDDSEVRYQIEGEDRTVGFLPENVVSFTALS